MPRRRRWTPVKGTRSRVQAPGERWLLGALDLPGRAAHAAWTRLRPARLPAADAVRDVLVLRLDRIGDVLMSLPALSDLRAALPAARIRLVVGHWSEEVAKSAPVDEVLLWSAPWAGRAQEGAEGARSLWTKARALRTSPIDLGIDLQGDVRASALLALSGARRRVGYANTGGAWLLTDVVPLDETVSWVEQNRRAVAQAVGRPVGTAPATALTSADRAFARGFLHHHGLEGRHPLVGLHPSGGRPVKQWDVSRWSEVGARLQREFGATVLITGSESDRLLAAAVERGLHAPAVDLTGKLSVRETLAVIATLDLFLSPDTGPMHMAAAAGTPSVSVFGPSDPARYFSAPRGPRHVVVRHDLWCAPCNLIRRPPAECAPGPPECLRLVTVDEVFQAAAAVLRVRP
jgi:ADP-heptose:LPS heptosyltransferase